MGNHRCVEYIMLSKWLRLLIVVFPFAQVLLKPWHLHQLDDKLESFQNSARKIQQGVSIVYVCLSDNVIHRLGICRYIQ